MLLEQYYFCMQTGNKLGLTNTNLHLSNKVTFKFEIYEIFHLLGSPKLYWIQFHRFEAIMYYIQNHKDFGLHPL